MRCEKSFREPGHGRGSFVRDTRRRNRIVTESTLRSRSRHTSQRLRTRERPRLSGPNMENLVGHPASGVDLVHSVIARTLRYQFSVASCVHTDVCWPISDGQSPKANKTFTKNPFRTQSVSRGSAQTRARTSNLRDRTRGRGPGRSLPPRNGDTARDLTLVTGDERSLEETGYSVAPND